LSTRCLRVLRMLLSSSASGLMRDSLCSIDANKIIKR
jgi:hypothetical protein